MCPSENPEKIQESKGKNTKFERGDVFVSSTDFKEFVKMWAKTLQEGRRGIWKYGRFEGKYS
jgi:hypothetical protein